MKIAVIGAGNVGRALGSGWRRAGHDVVYVVRDVAKATAEGLEQVVAGPVPPGADVVVLATPWDAVESAIRSAGNLTGKVLIDATNPLGPGLSLVVGHTDSGGETIARLAPGARTVKAFNTIGFNIMADPALGDRRAFLPVCGDDAAAKQVVLELGSTLGFDAVDFGPLANARLTEPFAALWITLAYPIGIGREFAFALVRR
jgi:hypothetical protein